MTVDYFYDEQLRRYLLQFVRIFSQFQYLSGKDAYGNPILRTIPATYASMDRQVNSIIQNNSENMILSTPQISCWITQLRLAPERIQSPNYIRTVNVTTVSDKVKEPGIAYNVQSYMPVPYDLVMETDIWTSSEFQKHQILEQILVIFNPSISLQTSNNPLDWSSLTTVKLTEVKWSSRSYPAGTTDNIDVASLTFEVPVWLNGPSKLQQQNIIQEIIADIGQIEKMNVINGQGIYFSGADLVSRLTVTPNEFSVIVSGNEVVLFNPTNSVLDETGHPITWVTLLRKYGNFRNNISQIRVKKPGSDIEDDENDIVGTIQLNPTDDTRVFWTIDMLTLPANTLKAVDAVINPLKSYPGSGLDLPLRGQRYLILEDIPAGQAWGNIVCHSNSIIEYDGNVWNIAFDATTTRPEYVVNLTTSQQLYWDGKTWSLAIDGEYEPGYWRLAL